MLELKEIHDMHNKAFNANVSSRERAADDLIFYFVTQWDAGSLLDSQLSYKGEFDILKPAGKAILADLAENPVQIDFQPIDEDREDSSETLDGMYRADNSDNAAIEAYYNAKQEAVVCGFGAWKQFTKYKTMRDGSMEQIVKYAPIYEANNTVFFDPNDRSLDKENARYVSVLTGYSTDGYVNLVKDLTGEEIDVNSVKASFAQPESAEVFPWFGQKNDLVYVVEFYHREKIKDKILHMQDPFGQTTTLRESDLVDVMDDMIDEGYEIIDEKKIERWVVTKYIASGLDVLYSGRIAGDKLPVVPLYGEHAVVEGNEYWEGVAARVKDPQRLRNFMFSYIADIASRSPRRKAIFLQEQIAGYEHMYQESGAENNYPYLLQNRKTLDGIDLPIGPIGEMPEQPVPTALPMLLQYTEDAILKLANPGVPQDMADPDMSGKAVYALQARLDMQNWVYQNNYKHAKRRDSEVYKAIVAEIYDFPRKVTITLPDGTRKQTEVMKAVIDEKTGETKFLNDVTNVEFLCISRIGPDYKTQRQQTGELLERLIPLYSEANPMREALQLKAMQHVDGIDIDDIRKFARKQLILKGIQEPETDEEKQMLQEAQNQPEKPSPEMVLAMAEDKKGQAALLKEQREAATAQARTQADAADVQISAFDSQTKRMEAMIKAQAAHIDLQNKKLDSFGKKLDNTEKMMNLRSLSNENLLKMAGLTTRQGGNPGAGRQANAGTQQ